VPLLAILLPCFNEEVALPGLLRRIEALAQSGDLPGWEIRAIVVDDGSLDATARIAQDWQGPLVVDLVKHGSNRGLGTAMHSGLMHFLTSTAAHPECDACLLAAMDADATHPPELLPEMLAKLYGDKLDVVTASRYAPGGGEHGLTLRRRFYSRLASLALRSIARVRGARDYSCGFRLYARPALARAQQHYGERLLTERGFVCMPELLVKLARQGAKVGEVGLDLHYELKGGVSKLNVPATIRRYVVFAWRILFERGYL
jgi:dolichol-phosphate mannosyltransferase